MADVHLKDYWSTHKPVCFVLGDAVSVTSNISKNSLQSISVIYVSSHYKKYGEYTREKCNLYLDM